MNRKNTDSKRKEKSKIQSTSQDQAHEPILSDKVGKFTFSQAELTQSAAIYRVVTCADTFLEAEIQQRTKQTKFLPVFQDSRRKAGYKTTL